MSDYVVLNLEDKITDTQKGAADSTVSGLKGRYEGRKQHRGLGRLFLGRNQVTEHRCVNAGPPIGFTTDATALGVIRAACGRAKKIYVVAHGDPRTTDVCYTNNVGSTSGVIQLATAKQLAAFLAGVMTAGQPYRIALVMCYGARCRDYKSANVNHLGMIPQADLVTSFAYRLFHALVHDHNLDVRLSAVIGKIQHDSTTGRALVEREDLIDVNMEIAEADKAKRTSMIAAVGPLKPQDQQDDTYKANFAAWKTSAPGQALLDAARDARTKKGNILDTGSRAEELPKYGKLMYGCKSGTLTIVSKYGSPGGTGLGPQTTLYSGPLLAPG